LPTNTQIDKFLVIGRDIEINILFDDLNNNNKSIRLLVGESGIGKSKLLDEFYRRLRYEHQDRFFVGYYDKNKALEAESQSFTYPFNIVIASLIENIKGSQHI
jgi:predicted ATPase